MASVSFLLFSTLVLFLVNISCSGMPLTLKLINRFSSLSPFPNHSFADYMDEELKRSPYAQTQGIQTTLDNNGKLFLVNFSIGEPPVTQFAYMDTGSNFLWIDCIGKNYNPDKSATYEALPCFDRKCRHSPLNRIFCDDFERCRFSKRYMDSQHTDGVLATEKLTFATGKKSTASIRDVVFGCSLNVEGEHFESEQVNGVFGLGSTYPSIVSNDNYLAIVRFSYCFGNIQDRNYHFNYLTLGGGVDTQGDQTFLSLRTGHYYVNVLDISFGGKILEIDPKFLRFNEQNSHIGVVIDTGTPRTWLAQSAYPVFFKKVEEWLDDQSFIKEERGPGKKCYRGFIGEDLWDFPTVKINFEGGAELELDSHSIFYQDLPGVFCLGVNQNEGDRRGLTVIGVMAQQNYHMQYDLLNWVLTIQRMDCSFLVPN